MIGRVPKDKTVNHPKTARCHFEAGPKDIIQYPVYWNPFNKAVQCHACGQTYLPRQMSTGNIVWLLVTAWFIGVTIGALIIFVLMATHENK